MRKRRLILVITCVIVLAGILASRANDDQTFHPGGCTHFYGHGATGSW